MQFPFWHITENHNRNKELYSLFIQNTVECRQFSYKYSQKTPDSSPVRVKYWVSFVDPVSDWCSASVPLIIYLASYNIAPGYNGTQL